MGAVPARDRGARDGPAFVAVDLETTGFDAATDRIIEVGATRFDRGGRADSFERLVDPGRPIPDEIRELTGIADADVSGAPEAGAVMEELRAFCGGLPIVGQSVGFDLGFLRAAGLELSGEVHDTHDLAAVLLPGSPRLSLAALARHFGVSNARPHRALADAEATRDVFLKLLDELDALPRPLLRDLARFAERAAWPARRLFEAAAEAAAAGAAPQRAPGARRAPGAPARAARLVGARGGGRSRGALRARRAHARPAPGLPAASGPAADGPRPCARPSPPAAACWWSRARGPGSRSPTWCRGARPGAPLRRARRDLDAHAQPPGAARGARAAARCRPRRARRGAGRGGRGAAALDGAQGAGELPLPGALGGGARGRGAARGGGRALPLADRPLAPHYGAGRCRRARAAPRRSPPLAAAHKRGRRLPLAPAAPTCATGAASSCAPASARRPRTPSS